MQLRNIIFTVERGAKALLKGMTTKQGVPLSCPVMIYDRRTGALLSRTTSKEDGRYYALGNHSGNFVIATDPLSQYNIAAQDNVK